MQRARASSSSSSTAGADSEVLSASHRSEAQVSSILPYYVSEPISNFESASSYNEIPVVAQSSGDTNHDYVTYENVPLEVFLSPEEQQNMDPHCVTSNEPNLSAAAEVAQEELLQLFSINYNDDERQQLVDDTPQRNKNLLPSQ